MGGTTPNNKVFRDSNHLASSILKCDHCKAPFAYRKKKVIRKGNETYIHQYTLAKHYNNDCPKIIRNLDSDIIDDLFQKLYYLSYLHDEHVVSLIHLDKGYEHYDSFTYKNEKINFFSNSSTKQKRGLLFNTYSATIRHNDINQLIIEYYNIPLYLICNLRRNSHSRKQSNYRFSIFINRIFQGYFTIKPSPVISEKCFIDIHAPIFEESFEELEQHIHESK